MNTNIEKIISLICNDGPVKTYTDLLNNDEGFKEFINNNKDKSRTEMIEEYKLYDILMKG